MSEAKEPRSLRAEILMFLDEHSKVGSLFYVSDEDLCAATGEPIATIQCQLDILEAKELTTTANTHQGRRARISPAGLLAAEELRNAAQGSEQPQIGFGTEKE